MERAIARALHGKNSVLSHVMYGLEKTDYDRYKSPNIIEEYETENKLFTVEYIFIRYRVRKMGIIVIASNKG